MTREQLKKDVLEIKKITDKWQNIDMLKRCLPENYFMADLIAQQDAYIDSLEGGWQPIETAPKGISCILTYDYKSVYEGTQDLEGHEGMWFSDSWEVTTPIAWMPLPKQGK